MAEKKEKDKDKEKGKGNGLKIIIIILLVLVVLGLGFTGWLFLNNKKADETVNNNTKVQTNVNNNLNNPNALNAMNEISSQTYNLDEFLVNLADEGGKRFFKVKLVLGYEPSKKKEKDMAAELEEKKPILRDAINSVLRSKKSTDLATQKNIDDLKKEILTRINPYFENGRINNLYFYDILIQ